MRVVRNINNNVSLCLDSQGREIIAFGKGIGFTKPPYEISLDRIERTFYDVNSSFYSIIAQIPENVLNVATKIVDYANEKMNNVYLPNVIFTLADHIQFAIKREKEKINIKLPLLYEVQHLYPEEIEIGYHALDMIKEDLEVELCKEEAVSIVLHLIDYDVRNCNESVEEENIITKCTTVIEQKLNVHIDKTDFNYSRFVSHMHYLMGHVQNVKAEPTGNKRIFLSMKEEYPNVYECALEIEDILNARLNDEEILYLILHINRLCVREDCYQ